MSTPVEAQSLSSLGQLFANPPQYPRNPTHVAHDALVLYLVRVPGSKGALIREIRLTGTNGSQMFSLPR